MTAKSERAQALYEKQTARRQEVLKAFADLGSKAQVGRMFNLSRERISQILKKETGARSPLVQNASWFDWKLVGKVVRVYRLRRREIAESSGVNEATVSHVIGGHPSYTTNVTHSKDAVSARVLVAVLRLVSKRIHNQQRQVNNLISEFQKIKYGYSED